MRIAILLAAIVGCGDRPATPGPEAAPAPTVSAASPGDVCSSDAATLADPDRSVALAWCSETSRHGIVGSTLAIARDGRITAQWSTGLRCRDRDEPARPHTAFRIGSITKSLVAATLWALAHEGRLALAEPIAPAFARELGLPSELQTITPRQLLDHTAGLLDALPDDAMRAQPPIGRLRSLVRPSGDPPGAAWRYANPGYALVGALLQRTTDTPWPELVRSRVLDPLGMTNTLPTTPAQAGSTIACGHLPSAAGPVAYDVVQDWQSFAFGVDEVAPSGAAIASAPDLLRLALALSDGAPPGTPASFATMLHELRTRAVPTGAGDRYALGLHVHALPDGTLLVRHGGNTGDFAAELAWVPERGFAVAVLANGGTPLRGTLAAALTSAGIDPRVLATEQPRASEGSGATPGATPGVPGDPQR